MKTSLDVLVALSRLTPNQRDAVIDRVVLERPVAEIGRELGMTRQGATQTIYAGMRRLRRELAK